MSVQTIIAQNYELFSGDTAIYKVAVKDKDDAAQDITGATCRFVMSKRAGGTPLVDLTNGTGITIDDATGGLLTITVPAADSIDLSGAYRWELQITDAAGRVSTVAFGTVTLRKDTA